MVNIKEVIKSYFKKADLKRIWNKKNKKLQYALISKSNPEKILQWFDSVKPLEELVSKVEKRVQWFKNKKG